MAAAALRRPRLFPLVTAAVLLSDLLSLLLKQATARPRPFVLDPEPEPLVRTALDLSLPSGHATTSFAGATLLALALPRLAVPLFLLAGAIAWSRVYVGVHYPTDVAAGALLGVTTALAAATLDRGLRRRAGARPTAPRSPPAGPPG